MISEKFYMRVVVTAEYLCDSRDEIFRRLQYKLEEQVRAAGWFLLTQPSVHVILPEYASADFDASCVYVHVIGRVTRLTTTLLETERHIFGGHLC